jgi:hypothetical protein
MAVPIPELTISPNINPISGTGSDIHGSDFQFGFGDISVGGDNETFMQKLIRDAVIAIIVGLSVKMIWGKK